MKLKKYILVLFVFIILAVNLFVFTDFFRTGKPQLVFSAVPERSAAFFYVENLDLLQYKIDSTDYIQKLEETNWIKKSCTHFKKSKDLVVLLEGECGIQHQKLLISLSHIGSEKLGFLSIVSFTKALKKRQLEQFFRKNKLNISTYKFHDFEVNTLKNFEEHESLHFVIYNNLLIASPNGPLVEEALSALEKTDSKTKTSQFKEFRAGNDSEANIHLYIDENKSEELRNIFVEEQSKEWFDLAKLKKSDWTYYALHFDSASIRYQAKYSGASKETKKPDFYQNQNQNTFSLDHFLPNNTAYFEATYSENNLSFQNNEHSYSYFKNWLDEEVAIFCLETFDIDFKNRSGLVLKANNIDTAKINLYLLNKEMAPVENYEAIAIYKMNAGVLSSLFENDLFSFEKPYFIFLKNYVVFANNINVLKTCIQKIKAKKTLAHTSKFNYVIDSTAAKIVYLNPQYCESVLGQLYKEKVFPMQIGKVISNYSISEQQLSSIGLIDFEVNKASKTTNLWSVKLDTISYSKAQIVINESNQRKEIIVQDEKNTIYLISQSGKVLLKKKFDQKILGDIYQIDLYKADKLFYVFNTKQHIFALKRDGSLVNGYPIKLPEEASNSLLVVNYDKAKKYRYFISCKNQKIYGYEANGKPLNGWSPLGKYGNITSPIRHSTFDGKDHIYFHNDKGTFYAFDRKGDLRFEPVTLKTSFENSFESTKNGFVNLSKGNIYKINLKGDKIVKTVADSTYNSFANYEKESAFAIANQHQFKLLKSKWTILGSKTLNDKILNINKLQIKEKIWFLVNGKTAVYLINDIGEIHRDFPMLTDSEARISSFYTNKNHMLLFTEGQELKAFNLIIED